MKLLSRIPIAAKRAASIPCFYAAADKVDELLLARDTAP